MIEERLQATGRGAPPFEVRGGALEIDRDATRREHLTIRCEHLERNA